MKQGFVKVAAVTPKIKVADTAYNNNYKKQQRVSFLNFLAELPNFVTVFVSAVLSGSLIVWMDFIDSLCNVADSAIYFFTITVEA